MNTHTADIEAFIVFRERPLDASCARSVAAKRVCSIDPRASFCFNREALVMSLEHSRERDMRIAEKHFRKGDPAKAKKVVLHCLRNLELGTQLRENGNVTDYAAASSCQAVIIDCPADTWSELEEGVRDVLDRLWTRITS